MRLPPAFDNPAAGSHRRDTLAPGRWASAPAAALCFSAIVFLVICAVPIAGCRTRPTALPVSDSLQVAAILDTTEIHLGDSASLTVTIVHPAAGDMEMPDLNDGRAVVVSGRGMKTKPLGDGTSMTTVEYGLTSFELGDHELPAGTVTFTGNDGSIREAGFPRTKFTTVSILSDENTPLRDIKGLVSWPAPVLWRTVMGASALALAVAIFFAGRRWLSRRRERGIPGPPPVPPHVAALKALRSLYARKWIEEYKVKPFYLELSGIVRRYIEDRFGLKAPERTTEEFIREAAGSGALSTIHQPLVADFLEQCDLVKFARHRPKKEDMKTAYDAAERLVNETKPAFGHPVETEVSPNEPSTGPAHEVEKPT